MQCVGMLQCMNAGFFFVAVTMITLGVVVFAGVIIVGWLFHDDGGRFHDDGGRFHDDGGR